MPRSHVCNGCGQDLVWVSAHFDAALGLAVVTCPACRTPSVRIPDDHSFIRKRNLAWVLLVVQALIALGAVTLYAALASGLTDLIHREQVSLDRLLARPEDYLPDLAGDLIGATLIPVSIGIWIGIGLRHISPVRAVSAFALLVVVALRIGWLLDALNDVITATAHFQFRASTPGRHESFSQFWTAGLMLVPLMIGVALAKSTALAARTASGMSLKARLARARKRRFAR